MNRDVLCDGCKEFRPCKSWEGQFWCVLCFPSAVSRHEVREASRRPHWHVRRVS